MIASAREHVSIAFDAYAAVKPVIAEDLRERTGRLREFLADRVRAAHRPGDAPAELDPGHAAITLLALVEGLSLHVSVGITPRRWHWPRLTRTSPSSSGDRAPHPRGQAGRGGGCPSMIAGLAEAAALAAAVASTTVITGEMGDPPGSVDHRSFAGGGVPSSR